MSFPYSCIICSPCDRIHHIEPSDIFGQDSDNNADHVDDKKDNGLGNFDADDIDDNKDILDKASVRFDEDDADANQDIFEY